MVKSFVYAWLKRECELGSYATSRPDPNKSIVKEIHHASLEKLMQVEGVIYLRRYALIHNFDLNFLYITKRREMPCLKSR